MKKNNKKGFTLVELLVVIAILAILATVSVVGYTSFTKKAQQSNAQTELTQARELIRADLLTAEGDLNIEELTPASEGTTATYAIVIKADHTISYTADTTHAGKHKDFDACLKANYTDLSSLKGTFAVSNTNKAITYTLKDAVATWNLATDEITVAEKTN